MDANRRWLAPLVVGGFVLLASLAPASGGATAGGVDKLLHVAGYAAIALTACWAGGVRTPRALAGVALAVTAFGVGIELVQPFIARHASALDALADLVGACLGAIGWRLRTAGRSR